MDHRFGKLISADHCENTIFVHYANGNAEFHLVTDEIVRVFAAYGEVRTQSKAVEALPQEQVCYSVQEEAGEVWIKTAQLCIVIGDDFAVDFYAADGRVLSRDYRGERIIEKRASWETVEMLEAEGHDASGLKEAEYSFQILRELEEGDDFYGLGDKSGFLNKKNYEYENWNSDLPQAHNEDFKALYKSIPILMCLKKELAYGIFFDNTFRSNINLGKENPNYYFYTAEDGNLDYYFIAGKDLKDIVYGYTLLTGTTPLPQLWTLGFQQSRWGYESSEDILAVAEGYRKHQIPLDVIHFDIDYMEHFKVFTWNEKNYGPKGELFATLGAEDIHAVTLIDPGTKKEDGYFMYEEGMEKGYFATDANGETYVNVVWPGESVFPDFGRAEVRKWWSDHHKVLTDMGVGGVWNDMNEPASFRGELPKDVVFYDEDRAATHAEMHNVYGHLMSRATFEGLKEQTGRRPFVITRACYAGSQKYTTVWTGDNQSLWHHLQMMIPQLCNLGLSGFAICGTDVGGFGADCTPELMCRWIEAGCFSPLFRNHSAKGSKKQEPWRLGDEVIEITKKYVELRYRVLPYLYDLLYQGEKTGLPVMRPLVLHYPNDPNVRNLNSEYLVGDAILVAPILEQGATARVVYLPEGNWIDYWTGERVSGGRNILREAPLDLCPIYLREGALIPTYEVRTQIGEEPYHKLILLATAPGTECEHFHDNGLDYAYREGAYSLYHFRLDAEGHLTTELKREGYETYDSIEVEWVCK